MSAKARLALDAALFLAFIAAYNPVATGIPVHIWLSFAIILPALLHLSLNWEWVVYAMSRLAGKLHGVSRIQLSVDAVLFISVVACCVSGVVVTPGLGAPAVLGTVPGIWYIVHSFTADLSTIAIVVHLALHWRWIAGVVRRAITAQRLVRPADSRVHP